MKFLSLHVFITVWFCHKKTDAWLPVSGRSTSIRQHTSSFQWPVSPVSSRKTFRTQPLRLLDNADLSLLLIASEEESWRQYVPLVVSVGVIVDILLGSPFANGIIRRLNKDRLENEEVEEKADNGSSPLFVNNWVDLISGSKMQNQNRNYSFAGRSASTRKKLPQKPY